MKLFFMIISLVCIQSCVQASRHLMPDASRGSRHGKMTNMRYPESHHPHRKQWPARPQRAEHAVEIHDIIEAQEWNILIAQQQERDYKKRQDSIASWFAFALSHVLIAETILLAKVISNDI